MPTNINPPGYEHWNCPFFPSDTPGPTAQKLTKVIAKRLFNKAPKMRRMPRVKKHKKFY